MRNYRITRITTSKPTLKKETKKKRLQQSTD